MEHFQGIIALFAVILAFACWQIYRANQRDAYLQEAWRELKAHGYEAFRRRLTAPQGRKQIRGRQAKLLCLDAAIEAGEDAEVRSLVAELNATPMSAREFARYNMTVLGYAVGKQDAEMALTARDALHRPMIRKRIAREADQVYDIYILRSADHIDELERFVKKCRSPSGKAMAYYRIAKQYYYLGETEQCGRYLDLSAHVYPQPAWQEAVRKARENDFALLGE